MSGSDEENYAQNRRSAALLNARRQRIRALNDSFRRSLRGGYVTATCGIQHCGPAATSEILRSVRTHAQFEAGDDPYCEHDFGAFDFRQARVFWRIDYYDKQLEGGSPDPADPAVTSRVLTIMLASEY